MNWLTCACLALVWPLAALAGPEDIVFPDPVEISADDIAWFRTFTVAWIDVETGSPGLLPPETGLDAFWGAPEPGGHGSRFEKVYLAFMLYGALENGSYQVAPARLSGNFPTELPSELTLTAEHRRLLSRAWWRQGFIDPKYPFGNYHYTEADIALALGDDVPVDESGTFDLPPEREAAYRALYHELPAALAIWIENAQLAPGNYVLPIDGWQTYGGLRETPATHADAARYHSARNFLVVRHNLLGPEVVDVVIEWMRITDAFAGRPWPEAN